MVVENLSESQIINDDEINFRFLSTYLEKLKIACKIYKGNFYLDSFNYFPISEENQTFIDIYKWRENHEYKHYFSKEFFENFTKNKLNYKIFKDTLVLGSSTGNNYYRNLLTFIPRLFFIPDEDVDIAIHRNTSNRTRDFIEQILKIRKIKLNKFIYLDDDFYSFKNSLMPQFFPIKTSIKILNQIFRKQINNQKKIYKKRKNSNYRRLVNESDLIDVLKKNDYTIIDLETYSIMEQIEIFASAKKIISPTSSALSNCVFCSNDAEIYEITPSYKHQYEQTFKSRYSDISKILNLKYFRLEADPVEVQEVDDKTQKFVSKKIIKDSNYYKNLIIKKENFIKFIENN